MPQSYRYGSTIKNYRTFSSAQVTEGENDSTTLSRGGIQLLRHSQKTNPWLGQPINQIYEVDIPYTGTGQDIDIIVVDNGVRIAHPEFCNTIVTNAKNPTAYVGGNVLPGNNYCDVLDIVLDSPYWIDPAWFDADAANRLETRWDGTTVPKEAAVKLWWSSDTYRTPGVTPPGGIAIPVIYTRLNACGNATQAPFDGSHGTGVASHVYGRTHGWAFNANKWTLWLDGFEDNYDLVFLIQQVFHQYKPTNIANGNKNPTISVNSWEIINSFPGNGGWLHYRGNLYAFGDADTRSNWPPYMDGMRFIYGAGHSAEMAANSLTTRADDAANAGIIFVVAAGNSNQQLVGNSHPNYNNFWSTNGEGGFSGNTNTYLGSSPGGVTFYNSFNRRGFPAQIGSVMQSGTRVYPVILVGALGAFVPDGSTTYPREYKARFSSYGDEVDCYAAGEYTLGAHESTTGGISRWDGVLSINSTKYQDIPTSGTSYSCPIAAGLIACKMETNRTWAYSNVKSWLLNSCGRTPTSQIYGVGELSSVNDDRWLDRYRIVSALPPVIIYNADNTSVAGPTYNVLSASPSVNEGSSVTFNVYTTNVADGTTLYWTIGTNAGDFGTTSGSFTINSDTGSFSVTPTADSLTEGQEQFTVRIRTVSVSGTIVATSPSVTINDTSVRPSATYSIVPSSVTINEGSSISFTVTTTNVPDGTVLYYEVVRYTEDIQIPSGSFNISSNTGVFNITAIADALTEPIEYFFVKIKTTPTGSSVAASVNIGIIDTSGTPTTYTIIPFKGTVNEGESLKFTILTTSVPNNTTLYWTIETNAVDFDITSGSVQIQNDKAEFFITPKNDLTTEGPESFNVSVRISSVTGSIVATTNQITIYDTSLTPIPSVPVDPVIVNPPVIITDTNIPVIVDEDNLLIIDVSTPNVANVVAYYWETTGSLGSVKLWSTSEKYVKLYTNSSANLKYNLLSGNLPYGLTLQDNGTIIGVVSSSTTSLPTKFITSSSLINTLTSSSNILTVNSVLTSTFNFNLISVDDFVLASNPGIPSNTFIKSITTNSFTISTATLASLNSGTVLSFYRSTASINTFSFSVSVMQLGGGFVTSASFSLTVINDRDKQFCELYVQPFLAKDQRLIWQNFINNSKIFSREILYRPYDVNYAVQKDLKCVLHHDYELLSTSDLGNVLGKNFYRRRFSLSNPKIRYAKLNGTVIYEVVYLDIVDYNTINGVTISKKININGVDFYPSTFDNMRQQLEQNGETNPELRPLHFKTLQENELRVDSYKPCVILCFAQPTKGKTILDRIAQEKIDFNKFNFEINKIFIKNQYTGVTTAIHISQNPGIS